MKETRLKTIWVIVLGVILPSTVLWADEKADALAHQTYQKWIAEQNAKVPQELKGTLENAADEGQTLAMKKVTAFGDLEKMGVAGSYKPYEDFPPFKLISAKGYELNGQSILVTEYRLPKQKPPLSGIIDVYLKKATRYERVLQLDDGCNSVQLVRLGPKGPIFLRTKQSCCGSGSGGSFYKVGKDGLTEVLPWGGWRAGVAYHDIDGDGITEVFAGVADDALPDDLIKRLEKIKGYEFPPPGGPRMYEVEVHRWTGNGFRKIGKYYLEGESGL